MSAIFSSTAGLQALPGELQTHKAELQPAARTEDVLAARPVVLHLQAAGGTRPDGRAGPHPVTADSTTVPHVLSTARSGLAQPSLAQQVVRGALPFQGFRHCQQNSVVGLLFPTQTGQRKQRLSKVRLSTRVSHPGHCLGTTRQKMQGLLNTFQGPGLHQPPQGLALSIRTHY